MGREKIDLKDSLVRLVIKMSEGNPGAITVLMEILQKTDGVYNVLELDDMNVRGWQIWIGYKDYCNCDLDIFIKAIRNRDYRMILKINNAAIKMGSPLRAVKMGASCNRL